ncbi:hypothetical protein J2Z60_000149 [Lactobacillus colini]|uniref:Uncharacterized protein n=1 Tax=Lactobacillus colini TaxID=1819254 RepID=A0ABS4MC72_9LACO|nr:hypothetical protein [Lactobacillus colini]MBP2056987.1 hypothetical protein [Lactobacillus colini]
MCKFCEINKKTHRGRDFYSEEYLSDDYISNLDGGDAYLTYIEKTEQDFYLVINEPDNEMYGRQISELLINNCPWCGRKLN